MDDFSPGGPGPQLLADLSVRVMGTAVEELDAAIVAGLGMVADVAHATTVVLRVPGQPEYAWPAPGTPPGPERIGDLELSVPVADGPVRAWVAAAGAVLRAAIERRAGLAGLAASAETYRSVLDNAGMVIVRFDAFGKIAYINKAWSDLTGIPAAEMIGKDPLYHLHPDDRETAAAHLAERLSGKNNGSREVRFIVADGSEHWVEVSGNVVFDEQGRPVDVIGVLQDVTIRHHAAAHTELALDRAEQARDHAERVSRSKSEFLSRMSHELRTPLNAILGFAQLLGDAPLDEEDADNLAQIERAGRLLLMLVNDAIDLARIETGRLALSIEPVDVETAVSESFDLIRPAASARGLTLHTATAERAASKVLADPNRLQQVLTNLLSNAVKYNVNAGRIEVSCRALPLDPETGRARLRIAVSDSGPGIPADRMDEVFVPFERLGRETSGIEGSGLGLSVTRTLVEAMDGAVGVGSVEGIGTTFYVDLPAA
jgi:PAS domain S-box-containing protein